MFSFPQMLGVPILGFLDGGMVAMPTVGAVLAWLLVAALVGSLLGILRERARVTARPASTVATAAVHAAPFHAHDMHREAA